MALSHLALLVALSTLVIARHPSQQGSGTHNDFATLSANIKNIVVLVEENRSHDTIFGDMTYNSALEGLVGTQFCNPISLTNPNQGQACSTATLANRNPDDPNHSISGVNNQLFSTFNPSVAVQSNRSAQTMKGFLAEQETAFHTTNVTRASEAINYFSQVDIPVLRALAENFTVFSEWFCAVPGPTNPNRAYITSGTSNGHGRNDNAFPTSALPQRSVFQQLSEANISWINYFNNTPAGDSTFYSWTVANGKVSTNNKPIAQFFTDAAAGNLPSFTYINPECCSFNSFHPPSLASDGQTFVKRIYEALRASPQWGQTLFILTFDEHGGFADHVPPPVGVPAGDNLTYSETAPDGSNVVFDFTRLGVRVPTFLISPFVQKGVVIPPAPTGGYTHTSMLAFVAKLWNLDFLTPRVAWSPTFENFFVDVARTDTPTTLPNPILF